MSSKLGTLIVRLLLLLIIPAIIAFATYGWLKTNVLDPLEPGNSETRLVEVLQGKSFKEICQDLERAGIIRHAWVLEAISRISKNDTRVRTGEYELSPGMTPRQVLAKLVSGVVFQRKFTVIEGESIWVIGKKIEAAGIITEAEFNGALTDKSLLAAAGILAESFEGFLFPETYSFSKPSSPRSIIWAMVEESDKHWPPSYQDQALKLGYSRYEILTLASIIQKEAGSNQEMPLISSVFHNRLKQGMKLQADPTVIYGVPNFDGNLTRLHLKTPTPYNTYTNFGLPIGPICNPGEAAIRAALFPSESTYLYFVADGTGKHVFSTTLKEHIDAVRKYQLGGRPSPAQEVDEEEAAAIDEAVVSDSLKPAEASTNE